jgi:hypothetical protein
VVQLDVFWCIARSGSTAECLIVAGATFAARRALPMTSLVIARGQRVLCLPNDRPPVSRCH